MVYVYSMYKDKISFIVSTALYDGGVWNAFGAIHLCNCKEHSLSAPKHLNALAVTFGITDLCLQNAFPQISLFRARCPTAVSILGTQREKSSLPKKKEWKIDIIDILGVRRLSFCLASSPTGRWTTTCLALRAVSPYPIFNLLFGVRCIVLLSLSSHPQLRLRLSLFSTFHFTLLLLQNWIRATCILSRRVRCLFLQSN